MEYGPMTLACSVSFCLFQNLHLSPTNTNIVHSLFTSLLLQQSRLLDSMKGCFQRRATALCAKVAGFTTLSSIIEPWREYDFVTKTPIPAILNFMVRHRRCSHYSPFSCLQFHPPRNVVCNHRPKLY